MTPCFSRYRNGAKRWLRRDAGQVAALVILAAGQLCYAQEAEGAGVAARIRARMEAAAAKQKAAAQRTMESAMPRQQNAVSVKMEQSLARQRESVTKQGADAAPAMDGLPPLLLPGVLHLSGVVAGGDCEPIPEPQAKVILDQAAAREGLEPALLRAVIRQESGFRPCAVSGKGAQGLMQLMPETAERLGVSDPFNPWENVGAGAKFLRTLLDRYDGNLGLALGAYNAGPGRVDSVRAIPPIPETENYVRQIMEQMQHPVIQ